VVLTTTMWHRRGCREQAGLGPAPWGTGGTRGCASWRGCVPRGDGPV